MRLLLKLFLWLVFLSPFALALLFWLSLSDQRLVVEQAPMSTEDLLRAKSLIRQQGQRSGHEPLQLTLSERDLELAGNYLLDRFTESSLEINIRHDRLQANATLRVPGFPSRPYLNLQLRLLDQQGQPNLVHLQINDFIVPRSIAKPLLTELLIQLYRTDEYRLVRSIVDELSLQDKQIHLQYYWSNELARKARALLKNPQPARQVYRAELRGLLEHKEAPQSTSLVTILPPLFQLAQKRSRQGDPVEENRALLSVLGYWASTRHNLAMDILGQDAGPPLRFRVKLNRRRDQARHFLISAALSANAGEALADIAGTLKELADADRGSGFSFIDLAANRAGTRFGELAITSAAQAREFQRQIASGIGEPDIVPSTEQLREGLQLEQFDREYGGLDSPAYREAVQHIDQLIDHCSLYLKIKNTQPQKSLNS